MVKVGALMALAAVCCLIVGCGSSSSSQGRAASSASSLSVEGSSSSQSDEVGGAGSSSGVRLVGCEKAYDGADPAVIVEFPPGTKGHGSEGPNAGFAQVEVLGTSAPENIYEEPASVTVYAGSVEETVDSNVFGGMAVEVEDPEAVTGCRIVEVGTDGPSERNVLEGPEEAVDGPLIPYGTEPEEAVQIAYEDSPGAA
jgi:hypothetical protein